MKKPRYTKEEDAIIIKTVQKYPENLQHAFLVVSKKINRSQGAIAVHYYQHLRKENKIFTVVTKNGNVRPFNAKNAKKIEGSWILNVYTKIKEIFK